MKTDYQRETEFLRRCIRYEETTESQRLEESIAQLEQKVRCVRRAVWLMVVLTAVGIVGLGYTAIFVADYSQNHSQFLTKFLPKVFCTLGLGSLMCVASFLFLGAIYRKELDQKREHCRHLAAKLLETWVSTSRRQDSKHEDGNEFAAEKRPVTSTKSV